MAKIIKIRDVLKDKYIVPDFQRDYTWEWKNLQLVLNDIKEAYSKGKKAYILGPIVVKETDGKKKLIDGQQRLTSLLIILKALEVRDNGFLGFENRDHVVELFRNIKDWYGDNPSCMKIWQVYNQTLKYFKQFNAVDRDTVSVYLLDNVAFIEKTLCTENIPHAFEVLNTAGEQLKKEDIAKAKLIAGMANLPKESELLNYAWLCCYDCENALDDELKNKEKDIYCAEDLATLYSLMKPYISENGECVKTSLKDVVESVENGKNYSRVIGGRITDFHSGEYSVPLTPYELLDVALSDENSLGKTIADIVRNSSGLILDGETAFKVIKSLLLYRIAFDKYVVKRNKGKWDWFLPSAMDEKYENRLIKAESMMAVSGTDASKEMVRIVKKALYHADGPVALSEAAVIKEIEHYAIERIRVNNVLDYLNEGTGTNHFVFHWLDYLLLYLNPTEEIEEKAKVFNFVETTSVEHFRPQHPLAEESEDWKKADLDNFGNLALITPSTNSRQNNSSPNEKADIAKNKAPESLKYELMMEIARNEGWNVKTSLEHGEKMKKLLEASLESNSLLLV